MLCLASRNLLPKKSRKWCRQFTSGCEVTAILEKLPGNRVAPRKQRFLPSLTFLSYMPVRRDIPRLIDEDHCSAGCLGPFRQVQKCAMPTGPATKMVRRVSWESRSFLKSIVVTLSQE